MPTDCLPRGCRRPPRGPPSQGLDTCGNVAVWGSMSPQGSKSLAWGAAQASLCQPFGLEVKIAAGAHGVACVQRAAALGKVARVLTSGRQ